MWASSSVSSKKAAHRYQQVADIAVLRADAQYQRVFDYASAKADAVVHREDRRGVDHAGQLGHHGLLVLAGEGVVVEDAFRSGRAAAGVLQLDRVGLDLLELLRM